MSYPFANVIAAYYVRRFKSFRTEHLPCSKIRYFGKKEEQSNKFLKEEH
jgi:hypothetical protein